MRRLSLAFFAVSFSQANRWARREETALCTPIVYFVARSICWQMIMDNMQCIKPTQHRVFWIANNVFVWEHNLRARFLRSCGRTAKKWNNRAANLWFDGIQGKKPARIQFNLKPIKIQNRISCSFTRGYSIPISQEACAISRWCVQGSTFDWPSLAVKNHLLSSVYIKGSELRFGVHRKSSRAQITEILYDQKSQYVLDKPRICGPYSVTNPRKFPSHKSISDLGFVSAFWLPTRTCSIHINHWLTKLYPDAFAYELHEISEEKKPACDYRMAFFSGSQLKYEGLPEWST